MSDLAPITGMRPHRFPPAMVERDKSQWAGLVRRVVTSFFLGKRRDDVLGVEDFGESRRR